jgi:hypothetical protein
MSIWDKYPNFSPDELRTLVALTAQAFLEADAAAGEVSPDLLELSPKAAAREIVPLLDGLPPGVDQGKIQGMLESEDLSTELCLKLLDEVRQEPAFAERIAAAYDARTGKMAIAEGVLLAGALVILAIKLRKISWGKDKKEITFDAAGTTVATFIKQLFGAGAV